MPQNKRLEWFDAVLWRVIVIGCIARRTCRSWGLRSSVVAWQRWRHYVDVRESVRWRGCTSCGVTWLFSLLSWFTTPRESRLLSERRHARWLIKQTHTSVYGTVKQVHYAAFTPGHTSPGSTYPEWATCIRIHSLYGDGHMATDTRCSFVIHVDCISATYLCHGRLVSLCIQQLTGDKLATILSPKQETCWRQQVDTTCIQQHVSWCKRRFTAFTPGHMLPDTSCIHLLPSTCLKFTPTIFSTLHSRLTSSTNLSHHGGIDPASLIMFYHAKLHRFCTTERSCFGVFIIILIACFPNRPTVAYVGKMHESWIQ